jgi:hypothetical protein
MAHLYYNELENLAYYSPSGEIQYDYGLNNVGEFTNLRSGTYWSGTAYAPFATDIAWHFNFSNGRQSFGGKIFGWNAMAVRPGIVAAAPPPLPTSSVPEPGTMLLMGSGLAGLAFWRRLKKG